MGPAMISGVGAQVQTGADSGYDTFDDRGKWPWLAGGAVAFVSAPVAYAIASDARVAASITKAGSLALKAGAGLALAGGLALLGHGVFGVDSARVIHHTYPGGA